MTKTKIFIIIGSLLLLAVAIVIATSSLRHTDKIIDSHKGMVKVESKPFPTENGWGYEILVDHKIFIRQRYIPAIQGEKAFATKEDAMKTADLVISKIVKGKVPSVTKADLSSLGISY